MSSDSTPDSSPPPAAPNLTATTSQSWPRRHPWATGLGALVLLVAVGSALGSTGPDSPPDAAEVAVTSEAATPEDEVTPTPEPVETVPEPTEPEPTEPEPTETVTVTAEPEPVETVTVTPEPASEIPERDPVSDFVEGEYDADLESLAQACIDDQDGEACWNLFLEAPLDSEYEALGLERSGDAAGVDETDVDVDGSAILEILWESMGQEERDLVCFGWGFNREESLDSFMDGADGMLTRSEASDFFDQTC